MTKIAELVADIRNRDLVLPEFQREYVWSREQAKQLMVSLFKEYPIGALLFWKTPHPPELKNLDAHDLERGTVSIILDGQQRLTTLYMLLTGEIPPYYTEQDIHTDPRELYFNLETGEFQYYQASKMRDNPLWIRVVDAFTQKINVFAIAKAQAESDAQVVELAERYSENLERLRQIRNIDIPVQIVPSHAGLDEAIDIFDRVNSQGTKLTDAELALTHVTGKWSAARREMKQKIAALSKQHFYFDLTFMTRALTGVVVRRALFETIHHTPREELVAGWQRLSEILDYLVALLPGQAYIHSTEDLNTTNVLIPIIVYLSLNEGTFPNERALKNAIHWLYNAHIWARYTGQTDQRLEHDVSIVVRETSPWEELRAQIVEQRGRIEVRPADFVGRGAQHPLYRMTFILAKALGAVDWFNGTPLARTPKNRYYIHSHHIFPQSLLYKELYDPSNHLDRKKVNEIANRAFLTAATNQRLSNRPPEEYLFEIEERYPGALDKQFIPKDPELWKVKRYEDFLEARRELIARKLNDFLHSLLVEKEDTQRRPVKELIAMGESPFIEFKTTLQWDVRQGQKNPALRHSVLKTIAAFLNTEGGTLIIGVEDDGSIYGLERDLALVQNSPDRFEQLLANLISDALGPQYNHLIRGRFEEVDGKLVYVLEVEKAPEPVFLKGPRGKEFYIRVRTTSRALDPEQTVEYIQMNWT